MVNLDRDPAAGGGTGSGGHHRSEGGPDRLGVNGATAGVVQIPGSRTSTGNSAPAAERTTSPRSAAREDFRRSTARDLADGPWPRSFTERFEQVASLHPDAPALSAPGESLNYRQALDRVETLARSLLARLPEEARARRAPIGVLSGSSVDSLVALLAAARTGHLVVPMDTQLPVARLRDIAELAHLGILVTDGTRLELARGLIEDVPEVVTTDELLNDDPRPDLPLPAHRAGPDPLIAVFTSGSTGRPKGVLETHDLIVASALTSWERYRVTGADRAALILPPAYAAGVAVLAEAVLTGACVWLFDPRDRGIRQLADAITAEGITLLHATPYLLRSMLDTLAAGEVLPSVRLVTTSGEAVHGRDVAHLAQHVRPGTEFWNWAGSSESGGFAEFRVVCGREKVPDGLVPAGLPEKDKEVRIVLPDGSRAPVGEPGEVFITSRSLAAGYLDDPERTAERFTVEADGRTTYRMGDLGRFDEHGNVHMLGRVDGAVKVRGYFVHLSEVEAAVLASPLVAEVAVVAVQAGPTHRLVAYVAGVPGRPTESPAALRRRLRERLPEFMVPGDVVPMASLPHTERGKVDRTALPPVPARGAVAPPQGDAEVALAGIWAELLGLTGSGVIGTDDDFQQLGADSLTVEEMLARVEVQFGVRLIAADLVTAPTLREFARRVESGMGALPRHPTAVCLDTRPPVPVLFCFAGAGALATSFSSLARFVRDRPVVGFQARGVQTRAVPDRTVEAAARRHLRELRVVQPRGPYVLLGHSMGGLVALEVARLLTCAGEEVASVILVDTILPRTVRPAPGAVDAASEPDGAAPGSPGRASGPLGAVTKLVRTAGHRLLPDGLPPLHVLPQRLRRPLAGVVHYGPSELQVLFDHGQVVARRHRVRPYAGRVVCLQLAGNPDGPQGWEHLLTGPREFLTMDAGHSAVLQEPHVGPLAEIVLAELPAADR